MINLHESMVPGRDRTRDPWICSQTRICSKTRYRLRYAARFTAIVHLAIQVACFDAIFDCITNMIGRLFNLHIVKSTPNNQTWERRGFLIFVLTLTSYFMFSSCSVKCSVKMTFGYLITCYKYSIRNFQKRFHQTVI